MDYKRELIEKQETPEQVRRKMEEKLNALKEQREKERQETVKNCLDRKFYEAADELRKNDSEAFAISCYLTHENQMLEKLRKRELELKEEEMYVKLYQYDILKKGK
jgi:transcription initiation factor IIE alpha subunit